MKWPSAPKVLTGLLVVLLPVLAYMQYRWVGQVSEGERERMQRNLETAADQFRADFDGEFIRAIRELTVGTTTAREGSSSNYTLRYTSWLNTADHPQVVADVYFVDAADDQLRLRRYNNGTHVFEPSLWTEELDRHRADFEAAYKDFKAERESNRRIRTAFSDEESLFVSQLQNFEVRPGAQPTVTAPMFGYTIIQLDESYLRGQMIPALAERHFTERGGEMYRVAVILGDDSKRVMYRSTPEATIDVSTADITAALLPPPTRGGRRGGRGANQQAVEEAPPRWRLLVQHQSGSLDAAVGTIRRRNLAISSGVLLLLTFAVVMLTATSRRAEKLAQQQMEFVAGVSHELRTPVAVIRSAAENLASGVVSGDRVKRYGQMLEGESRRLGDMVERVLQYAGIESGFNTAARVPLAPMEIIESAVESALPLVGPGEVTIHREIAPDLPPVLGDATALRSAVQNLVANAVKYGGRDRWVGVRAQRVRERRRDEVRITVSDHGPGIPAADLPHIFEPFYRGADAIERQIHGHGLGLSLVRRIVVAHGGQVTVATRPGAGTSFTISLPATVADTTASPVGTEMRVGAHS
ncbi:MAG: sensor histidine kinase [Vicinamibacterales bacterium]